MPADSRSMVSDNELLSEISFLKIEKKKLTDQVIQIESEIIGKKEILFQRKLKREIEKSKFNQDLDDFTF